MSAELAAHKIVYMAVPKAACTSVKAAMALIDDNVELSRAELERDEHHVHDIYGTERFRQRLWTRYVDDGWWRFSVVRDPLKRLLSVYTDIILDRQSLPRSRNLRARPDIPKAPDPDYFFQNLELYMSLSSIVKHHALPSSLFIGPKPFQFSKIYTVEQLDDLRFDLAARTGKAVEIPHFNSSGSKLSFDELKPVTREVIRAYLAPEYQHLDAFYKYPG